MAEGLRPRPRGGSAHFGISLLGGDTTATPGSLTLAITAFGHVPAGRMLRRAGARPGDLVFVSGTIGDAGGGLACLKGEGARLAGGEREHLIRRFRLPEPRLGLGVALRGLASAGLDVSDGMLADLGHVAETSRVRIAVEAKRIPLSPALVTLWPDAEGRIVRAATAGDDYELAFTAPEAAREAVFAAGAAAAMPVTEIGRVSEGAGVMLLDPQGHEIAVASAGFTHF